MRSVSSEPARTPTYPCHGWVAAGPNRGRPLRGSRQMGRSHHLVVGPTGSGKSGYLLSQILGALNSTEKRNYTVLDPKGDLVKTVEGFLSALRAVGKGPRPEDVLVVAPFQSGVRLSPFAPWPGLSTRAQAMLFADLLSDLGDGIGARMRAVCVRLYPVVVEGGGSLPEFTELLGSVTAREHWAQRCPSPEARTLLLEGLEAERAAVASLLARCEVLLALPALEAALGATQTVPAQAFIETPLVLVDTSGAPGGFAAASQFVAGLLFRQVTAAIFARDGSSPPVRLIIDEFPELLRSAGTAADAERLFSQARFKGVSLTCVCQDLAQLDGAGAGFTRSVLTNTAGKVLFRPKATDLSRLQAALPLTGRQVDPTRPDRLLSEPEERRALFARLASLPDRTAVLLDEHAGASTVFSTLNVPYEEAARRARKTPAHLKDAFVESPWTGDLEGMLEDVGRRLRDLRRPVEISKEQAENTGARKQQARRSTRRPKLVLPQ